MPNSLKDHLSIKINNHETLCNDFSIIKVKYLIKNKKTGLNIFIDDNENIGLDPKQYSIFLLK